MDTPFSIKNVSSLVLFAGLLLLSLMACSTSTATTAVPSQTITPTAKQYSPAPTPLPAGIVLYQADWSHGLGASPGTHGWKVVQGQLESGTSGSASFTIPYTLSVSDYAIEFRLQVVRSLPPYGGHYELFAPKVAGKDGYHAGVFDLKASGPHPFGLHPQSNVYLDPYSDTSRGSGIPQDYEPGSGWHTYRLEVRGNEASLLDNGTQIGSASSLQTDTLSNGPIQLNCSLVVVRLSGLRILTL